MISPTNSELSSLSAAPATTSITAYVKSYTAEYAHLEITEAGERKLHSPVTGWFPMRAIRHAEAVHPVHAAVSSGQRWTTLNVDVWALEALGVLL